MKKYTDAQLLKLFKKLKSTPAVSRHTKISQSRIRERLGFAYPGYAEYGTKQKEAKKEDKRPIAGGTTAPPDESRKWLQGQRFVFTAAQNNTYVHKKFLKALELFCEHNDAQLVVSRFTYNKSGFQNGTKENTGLWYDPALTKYIVDESRTVTSGLVWCGELDVLPTAENPVSGFENYTFGASSIIPHAKVRMRSLPRMKGEEPRFLYTTGAVTLRNYIQRKAGQKAEFHHVFGALFVEIDEQGDWFARQLIADKDGTFYDLDTEYTSACVSSDIPVEAVQYGDIHIEKADKDIIDGLFNGPHSLTRVLKPKVQFIHDLSDFSARNHHNIKDPFFLAEKHFMEDHNVKDELEDAANFLLALGINKTSQIVVVESNHDLAYRRWLKEADIRTDPENAEFFHRSNAEIFAQIRNGAPNFNIYEWALRKLQPEINKIRLTFLREDDSFTVKGIECGMHGHRGPNGSRGSAGSIKSIGRKVNIGHSHSAGILDGCYIAGVSADLDMGYNKGPSSWSHSHIVIYKNGKRAIITQRGNRWRA